MLQDIFAIKFLAALGILYPMRVKKANRIYFICHTDSLFCPIIAQFLEFADKEYISKAFHAAFSVLIE